MALSICTSINTIDLFIENKQFYSLTFNRVDDEEKLYFFSTPNAKAGEYPLAYYSECGLIGLDLVLLKLLMHYHVWNNSRFQMPIHMRKKFLEPLLEQTQIMLSAYHPDCEILQFTDDPVDLLENKSDGDLFESVQQRFKRLSKHSMVAAIGHRLRGEKSAHYAMIVRFNQVIVVCHSFDINSIDDARRRALVALHGKAKRFAARSEK